MIYDPDFIYQNETKHNMESAYDDMTSVEKSIADFFMKNKKEMDFSSKTISEMLYISEATLSRFAKKCGYAGYREFIFSYKRDLENEKNSIESEKDISIFTKRVKSIYQNVLAGDMLLKKENQLRKIAKYMNESERVLVYGIGSSGYVADEFQLRFMRLGLDVTSMTDSQMIKMSGALVNDRMLVIGITLSGKTPEVLDGIRYAKKCGAKTILITANSDCEIEDMCDELVLISADKDLDMGTKISPQVPILIIIDILYAYYFANDSYFKAEKYKKTLMAIKNNEGKDENV